MKKQDNKKSFSKRRTIKFTVFSLVFVTCVFIAYSLGYIPIGLSVKPPIGNFGRVPVEQYLEEYPEVGDMPNLDKILYEVIGTDEPLNSVLNSYKEELEREGYALKYEGSGYAAERNFVYVGYLKGFTAVGIILCEEAYEEFNYETMVVYMTGNAYDFIPLLNWYQQKYDPGAWLGCRCQCRILLVWQCFPLASS